MARNKTLYSNSIEQQATFVNMNPAPVFQITYEGEFLFYNPAAEELINRNKRVSKIQEVFSDISNEFIGQIPEGVPVRREGQAGGKIFLLTLKKDIQSSSIYIFGSDITERKKTEAVLEESEKKFNIISKNTSLAVIIIDEEGKITFWNKAADEIFGFSSSEILGENLFQKIFPGKYRFFTKRKNLKEVFEDDIYKTAIEIPALRKDNKEISIELSASTIISHDQWFLMGFMKDITEKQQRKEEFSREISQYIALINTVPAMMYIKDIDHRFIFANELFCKSVGKSLNEIKGKTAFDILPPEKADFSHADDIQAMENDTTVIRHEESFVDSDGAKKWYSTTKVSTHDKQGLVSGVVGLIQDVTELHIGREKLVQADKLAGIGTLAAGVAHEINNPIGFINSNINTMARYLQKIKKYCEETHKSELDKEINDIFEDFQDAILESSEGTERVKNIVNDLKSFSRVDKAEKESVNLNDGLESTLNIVWNELKYKCKVEKDFGDIPNLYCYPNQLNQVLMNILVNAGQAIKGSDGLINIRTWFDKDKIFVSIKDNGVGISQSNLKKIYEPFYTTKDVGKGTGLGLSLAYDIIKKHHGHIDVLSEINKGSEFIIGLPIEGITNE